MLGAAIAYNIKKWLNYQEQKTKNSSSRNKKDRKRSLFFVFDAVALISSVQYKKQDLLLKLAPKKNRLLKPASLIFKN